MRILVLGSTGFLGARVCNEIRKQYKDYHVIEASLSKGNDLRAPRQVDNLFKSNNPDVVINCAAHVGGIQYGLKYPIDLFQDNMNMIVNIFRACNNYKIKRLIQPVSNCAYPSHLSVYKEEEFWNGPVHDSVFTFAETRRMMVVAAKCYFLQSKLDTISIIHPNLYGPGDHFDPLRSHALGALISKIYLAKKNEQKKVTIWGTGKPIREWLYIQDAAQSIINALFINPYSDIINVGTGSGISIKDIAYLIKREFSWDGDFIFDESKTDGAPIKVLDGSKGKTLLKMKNLKSINEGLKETIEYYKSIFN